MRLFIVLILLLVPASVMAECQPTTDTNFSCASREFTACEIQVNGRTRQYCQHIPNQGGALPVVFSFHGAGGKARALVNLWRSHTEQSVILIAPQALVTKRYDECLPLWRQLGGEVKNWSELTQKDSCSGGVFTDDLDFVAALMDHLEVTQNVENFYATGFSNGADFTFQLMMTSELAERFSGFATSGAGMTQNRLNAIAASDAAGKYTVNTHIKRPFLVHFGTEDKKKL